MANGQYPAILTSHVVNTAYHSSIHSLNLPLPCFPKPSLICPPTSVRIFQPPYNDLDMDGPQKVARTIIKIFLQTLGNKPFLKHGSPAGL